MKKCKILKVNLCITTMKELLDYIQSNIRVIKGGYLCFSNVHTTVTSFENEEYLKIQNSSILSLPDGAPLSIIMKKRGFKEADRITGPDFMSEIFKISEELGYTHFFYGSKKETLNLLEANLKEKYPKLNIVGLISPPFRPLTIDENREVIQQINQSNADFLWVGLGAPKQEIWMFEQKNKINSIMVGVGAGFDYHANLIKRAPILMQKYSLEWLYRLIQDPKRLLERYITTNTKFIYYILKDLLKRKKASNEVYTDSQ
jgi:N-acetylglucosaminyldiphosphoundecaprenol N-acetyl-beta-D-mannosaminyltransferase